MIVNEGGKKLPKLTTPGTSADLLTGKELIDQYGRKVEGSMPINSNETPTFGTTELEKSGRLRATAIYRKGFYNGGTSSTSYYLPTQAGTTITPGTKTITAVPSGKYTLGAVEVAGDSDLKAENIKKGINIFGVTGTADLSMHYQNAANGDITIRSGNLYDNGDFVSSITVKISPDIDPIAGHFVLRGDPSGVSVITVFSFIRTNSGGEYVDRGELPYSGIFISGENYYYSYKAIWMPDDEEIWFLFKSTSGWNLTDMTIEDSESYYIYCMKE